MFRYELLLDPDLKANRRQLTREQPNFNGPKNEQMKHAKQRRGAEHDVQVLFSLGKHRSDAGEQLIRSIDQDPLQV